MNKDSVLYKAMARYRIKFLIINLVLTVMLISYTVAKLPYLKTAWFGETPLKTERFLKETKTITVDRKIELGRKDRRNPDGSYLKKSSYWQDDKYLFELSLENLQKTDVSYEGTVSINEEETKIKTIYELYVAQIGGRNVAVLAFSGQEVKEKMTGCIVHMQKPVLAGISELIDEKGELELSEYIIDVRGLEMEAESSDHLFFWIYLAALLLLYIKLLVYFVNPLRTPTYRQLYKYGKTEDIADEIDRQAKLPSARRNGKDLVLEDFILTKSTMKLAVTKNHTKKH